jgi:hypothetical protein
MPPPSPVVDGHLLVQSSSEDESDGSLELDESARNEEAQEFAQEQRWLFLDLDTTDRETDGTPDENRGHQNQGRPCVAAQEGRKVCVLSETKGSTKKTMEAAGAA